MENITEWKIEDVKPYEKNPRRNEKAVEKVAASIEEFGFQQPIVVDEDGVVIAGHTRLKAAKFLELKFVPVVVAVGLSEAQINAYRIADNKTNELAEWDLDLLPLELTALEAMDFDITNLGFTADELTDILATEPEEGKTDGDDIPETPDEAITQPGDVWILGDHRLLCGDSTKAEDVEKVLDGQLADALITDPPYGVDYVGKTDDKLEVKNDDKAGLYILLKTALGHAVDNLQTGGCVYVFAPPGPQFLEFATVLTELEVWRQTLCWAKNTMVLGHSDYHYRHEAIFYGWRPGGPHRPVPDRSQTTLWEYDKPSASRLHPTMKPIAMPVRMLENSTAAGDTVFDPFAGSGTTLLACQQTGRRACVVELHPNYCDVIVQRWEDYTGRKAERVA